MVHGKMELRLLFTDLKTERILECPDGPHVITRVFKRWKREAEQSVAE